MYQPMMNEYEELPQEMTSVPALGGVPGHSSPAFPPEHYNIVPPNAYPQYERPADYTQCQCVCGHIAKNKFSMASHKGRCVMFQQQKRGKKKRKRTNNPIIQNPNRKRARQKKPLTPPTAFVLFKEETIGKDGENDQISKRWNMDRKLQEEYNQLAQKIYQEINKLKVWEQEMLQYKSHEVTDAEIEGEGNHLRPRLFESKEQKEGTANFLESVQIFGTDEDQKECFMEKYNMFKKQNGIRLPPAQCGGAVLDLFELYKHVVLRGGLAQCLRKDLFLSIGRAMKIRGTDETIAFSLRVIYFKYLFEFEQKFQLVQSNASGGKKFSWEQDYSGAASSRPTKRIKLEHKPSGLRDNIFGPEFTQAAAMAIASRDSDMMTWALNRLMFASFQTQTSEVVFLQNQNYVVDALLGLLGVPEEVSQISCKIPIMNDWKEGANLQNLCVDLLAPEASHRRKFSLCALRVLMNFSLTSQNQQGFLENPHLCVGFLQKVCYSDDLSIKSGCMKVLANISWCWVLKAENIQILMDACEEGLSMYAFDDQHSDMPALAESTLQMMAGLSANLCNRALLVKHMSDAVLRQASEFILSTDLNLRLAALECLCHLCEMAHGVPEKVVLKTQALTHMSTVIKETCIPENVQRACAFLASMLFQEVMKNNQLAKRHFAHLCTFATSAASNKNVADYCSGILAQYKLK